MLLIYEQERHPRADNHQVNIASILDFIQKQIKPADLMRRSSALNRPDDNERLQINFSFGSNSILPNSILLNSSNAWARPLVIQSSGLAVERPPDQLSTVRANWLNSRRSSVFTCVSHETILILFQHALFTEKFSDSVQ